MATDLAPAAAPDALVPDRAERRIRRVAWIAPWLAGAAMVGLWWGATIVFEIRPFFLPAPDDIAQVFGRMPGYLMDETVSTLKGTVIGFALAAGAGLFLAVVLAASPTVERATMPLLVVLNSIPKIAIAPLLIAWLGFGLEPKVVMVALLCFFPIVVASLAGLVSTPADLRELAHALSGSPWQTFVKVRFPWALPQIFVGLKVGISLAVTGAVVAEIVNPNHGLGAVIVSSSSSSDTPLAFAAIVMLAVLSVSLFYLVVTAERLLLPWARSVTV